MHQDFPEHLQVHASAPARLPAPVRHPCRPPWQPDRVPRACRTGLDRMARVGMTDPPGGGCPGGPPGSLPGLPLVPRRVCDCSPVARDVWRLRCPGHLRNRPVIAGMLGWQRACGVGDQWMRSAAWVDRRMPVLDGKLGKCSLSLLLLLWRHALFLPLCRYLRTMNPVIAAPASNDHE